MENINVSNNTNGLVFRPRYWIEDRNGAACMCDGEFAYSHYLTKNKQGKEVMAHDPVRFDISNRKFIRFRSYRKASNFRHNNVSLKTACEIKSAEFLVAFKTPTMPVYAH